MTTFYLDPVNGNDAADGTTFANRWKTFTSGATFARVTAGDIIRVIASPDPVSIGAAQWTDNSGDVVPSGGMPNKLIDDCESGWVAQTNITVAHNTQAKTGSLKLNITPASGFTTGKMCHKQLPATLNLSAFQQLSMWWQVSSSTGSRAYEIKLCSDTNGDTPLATLAFTENTKMTLASGSWMNLVLDNGGPLPDGVNSIALYATLDPGTVQTRIDNIVACKAPGASDEVTHGTLIGKNTSGEPYWYNISYIDETKIILGAGRISQSTLEPPMPYRGTTESVTTYIRNCLEAMPTTARSLQNGGTSWNNKITISGGWDRTNMSTQSGETWFNGKHQESYCLNASQWPFIRVEKFGVANYTAGLAQFCKGWDMDLLGVIGCDIALSPLGQNSTPGLARFKCRQIWGANGGINAGQTRQCRMDIGIIHGDTDTAGGALISGGTYNAQPMTHRIGEISNNRSYGLMANGGKPLRIAGCTFKLNELADIRFPETTTTAEIELLDSELLSATPVSVNNYNQWFQLSQARIGGNPTAHELIFPYGKAFTQSAVVKNSALAWAVQLNNFAGDGCNEAFPLKVPLARVACAADALVTIKCWVRRTNTTYMAGLFVEAFSAPGVDADVSALCTVGADIWEELTLTFTPTEACVVPVYAGVAYGTTHTAYFADMTITQA